MPLPVDVIVADASNIGDDFMAFVANSKPTVKAVEDIAENDMILDIGPKTAQQFSDMLKAAKTILWNGPVGVFEVDMVRAPEFFQMPSQAVMHFLLLAAAIRWQPSTSMASRKKFPISRLAVALSWSL